MAADTGNVRRIVLLGIYCSGKTALRKQICNLLDSNVWNGGLEATDINQYNSQYMRAALNILPINYFLRQEIFLTKEFRHNALLSKRTKRLCKIIERSYSGEKFDLWDYDKPENLELLTFAKQLWSASNLKKHLIANYGLTMFLNDVPPDVEHMFRTWTSLMELRSDFKVTREDLVRFSFRTCGIHVFNNCHIDNVPYEVFEPAGVRNERKKWVHLPRDLVRRTIYLLTWEGCNHCVEGQGLLWHF